MAEDAAVGLEERDTGVADGVELRKVGVVGEKFDDAIRKMQQASFSNDLFARSPFQAVLKIFDELIVHPEGEGTQDIAFGNEFSDPDASDIHGLRGGADQRLQEFAADFGGGSFEQVTKQVLGLGVERITGHLKFSVGAQIQVKKFAPGNSAPGASRTGAAPRPDGLKRAPDWDQCDLKAPIDSPYATES
jgi:hypothetical protein